METLDGLFPVIVARALLPKYLKGLVLVAGLFSPRIRNGIPAMNTMKTASIESVAKRQAQLQRNEPTREDMLGKAFSIYEAHLNDQKKPPQQKMDLGDLHEEALIALYAFPPFRFLCPTLL